MLDRVVSAASHEQACARVASLFPSRWLSSYVRSKLRSDPAFPIAWELLSASTQPVLDVGCGVGLLAFYLRARGSTQAIIGVDIDRRKIDRALATAAQHEIHGVDFIASDVAIKLPPFTGNVVVFDVLHYMSPPQQQRLLLALAALVSPGASLLLRDCPRDGSARFWTTYAAETFAQTIAWNWRVPLHFPTAESINDAFAASKFQRDVRCAWGRTPFNNRLFTFVRRHFEAAPPTE